MSGDSSILYESLKEAGKMEMSETATQVEIPFVETFLHAQSKIGNYAMSQLCQSAKLHDVQVLPTPLPGVMLVRGVKIKSDHVDMRLVIVIQNQVSGSNATLLNGDGKKPRRVLCFSTLYSAEMLQIPELQGTMLDVKFPVKLFDRNNWKEFDSDQYVDEVQLSNDDSVIFPTTEKQPIILDRYLHVDRTTLTFLSLGHQTKFACGNYGAYVSLAKRHSSDRMNVGKSYHQNRRCSSVICNLVLDVSYNFAVGYFEKGMVSSICPRDFCVDMLRCLRGESICRFTGETIKSSSILLPLVVASVETIASGDESHQNVVVPQQDEPMEAVSNEDIDLVPDHSSV
jgi:hypothetical protein